MPTDSKLAQMAGSEIPDIKWKWKLNQSKILQWISGIFAQNKSKKSSSQVSKPHFWRKNMPMRLLPCNSVMKDYPKRKVVSQMHSLRAAMFVRCVSESGHHFFFYHHKYATVRNAMTVPVKNRNLSANMNWYFTNMNWLDHFRRGFSPSQLTILW